MAMTKEIETMTPQATTQLPGRLPLIARLTVATCALAAVLLASLALAAGPALAASAPSVDSESTRYSTQDVSTSRLLQAQINPNGLDATYHFEYGTTTGYGTSVPIPDADIGSGTSDVAVSQRIASLALNTTYHYRVVATNTAGTTSGADQTFTSGKGFGFASFGVQATNQDGSLDTQAGSHPYQLTTGIFFNTVDDGSGSTVPEENAKDIITNLPPGLIGDPAGMAQCTQTELAGHSTVSTNKPADCPAASQVGVANIDVNPGSNFTNQPVYNMVPPAGDVAQLGMNLTEVNAFIDIKVRTGGDYGVTATVSNPSTLGPLRSSILTLWGVPADPRHDQLRQCPGGGSPCSSGTPLTAFLTMPTSCAGPLTSTVSADSYQHPGRFVNASSTSQDAAGNPVGMTGCSKLDFNPSITLQPDTSVADSPAGLSVDLRMPTAGLLDPNGLAEANLKEATVTLPQGVSVNPSSASGLAACTPAQIGIDNASEPSCPDASKVGSVQVDTPLLPDPLKGSVYVAQQNDNPFNSLLAIYVTAEGDGALIKLAGHVVADPVTGQLTTSFDNNPQLPFTDFKLDFFGGPHAVLATPESCGVFSSTSSLSPWSGTGAIASTDPFTIDSGCVSGFAPSLTAGTANAQAGAFSPFVVSLQRADTDQNLSGVSVTLPPGMVGKLAGVQECSDAQLAAAAANSGTAELASPSCPAGSQVGTVTTGAGTGPDPYFIGGKEYLTGPYKGAPYGIAAVVPAVAGPYDLGTVVVRQALYIDPTTAQVTVVSDPFPQILDGIPLRLRRVDVSVDRPGFTLNPTSCSPMNVNGMLSSTGGMLMPASSRFQVGGCQELGFSPRLSFKLTGNGQTHSGNHPTLTATLTQPAGQANIRSAKVALPLSMALDINNSKNVCNYDTAQAVHGGAVGCPASTIVGQATAQTPLLDRPLTGPVYLVQGIRFGKNGQRIHTLPSLLIPLRGQIAIDLRASSAVNGAQQLVTTFSQIPDAPVSKFTLQINGGRKGLLVITGRGQSICNAAQVANASFGAQTGKAMSQNDTLAKPCGRASHAKRHGRRRNHSRRR
jgi:hypothetical protein